MCVSNKDKYLKLRTSILCVKYQSSRAYSQSFVFYRTGLNGNGCEVFTIRGRSVDTIVQPCEKPDWDNYASADYGSKICEKLR